VHFEPSQVQFVGSRKELAAGSVPTLFCHCGGGKNPQPVTFTELEHSYAQMKQPVRHCLAELQVSSISPQRQCPTTMKRFNSSDQENAKRPQRRRTSISHSSECAHSRPPLKDTPPSPSPLPSKPSSDEVLKLIEENARLKQKVSSLQERADLASKVISIDQFVALKLGSHRGVKWKTSSLIEGLCLRFTCGATGYEQLRKTYPYPSARTLRRCVQNINFQPGILDVVFECLKDEVPKMRIIDRDCVLVFDEMSIEPRIDVDCSTGCYIGHVTIPLGDSCETACKAMVFMINGLAKRFKQVVGYHFCGARNNTEGVSQVLIDILWRCENLGLNVVGIVCDMGNRGVLKKLGFSFEAKNLVYGVPNPANRLKTLYVLPDFVHVFKSAKEMLVRVKTFKLPDEVVTLYKLPTNVVNMELVDWLEETQGNSLLKYAPRLKTDDIHPCHFKKMKVSTATNVLSPQVGGALMHIGTKYNDPECVTTGWFIKVFRRWFTLVTSRGQGRALSHQNMDAFDDAIELIKLIRDIFARCSFGETWHVNQNHVVMACQSLLEIQGNLLSKEGFKYLCCGNFTQDSIENVFSCMRIQRPKPSPLQFKFRLKQFILGKISVKVANMSYSPDDTPSLISLLSTAKVNKELFSLPETSSMIFPPLEMCPDIRDDEKDVLYRMSGYVLLKMKKRLKCTPFFESLLHQEKVPHPRAGLTVATDIKEKAQVRVGNPLYELFVACERMLVGSLHVVPRMQPCDKVALTKHIASTMQRFPLPTCHRVHDILTGRFLAMRFSQLSRYLTKIATPVASPFGSKSMGMRVLADQFNPARRH